MREEDTERVLVADRDLLGDIEADRDAEPVALAVPNSVGLVEAVAVAVAVAE